MPDARPPLPYDFWPPVPSFTVVSNDIADGQTIGQDFVYAGKNLSPHLRWEGFPSDAQSFAVTCFDPDAPTGSGFWHWVLFDIPASVTELSKGAASAAMKGLPSGAIHARNDYGTKDYGGSAPPKGDPAHRYVFTVHAVDVASLGLDDSASPAYVGFNLRFHDLGRGQVIGLYAQE